MPSTTAASPVSSKASSLPSSKSKVPARLRTLLAPKEVAYLGARDNGVHKPARRKPTTSQQVESSIYLRRVAESSAHVLPAAQMLLNQHTQTSSNEPLCASVGSRVCCIRQLFQSPTYFRLWQAAWQAGGPSALLGIKGKQGHVVSLDIRHEAQ